MTSPIQSTWTWANSERRWGTGEAGVLQSMGLQGVGHDLVTEQQQKGLDETTVATSWKLLNPGSEYTAIPCTSLSTLVFVEYLNNLENCRNEHTQGSPGVCQDSGKTKERGNKVSVSGGGSICPPGWVPAAQGSDSYVSPSPLRKPKIQWNWTAVLLLSYRHRSINTFWTFTCATDLTCIISLRPQVKVMISKLKFRDVCNSAKVTQCSEQPGLEPNSGLSVSTTCVSSPASWHIDGKNAAGSEINLNQVLEAEVCHLAWRGSLKWWHNFLTF